MLLLFLHEMPARLQIRSRAIVLAGESVRRMPFSPIPHIAAVIVTIGLASHCPAVEVDEKSGSTLLIGSVLDAETEQPMAARIYLEGSDQQWLFVRSADEKGSAWPYAEEWVPMPASVERHTTVSAHPFQIRLTPGEYEIKIERGKEYFPLREHFIIPTNAASAKPAHRVFRLRRWINMAAKGWYSGETHVHRRFPELPNVLSAEDLNVAFPVTYWTTASDKVPDLAPSTLRSQGPSPFGPREDRGYDPIYISAQHVIVPRNTEYEIFSIDGQRHTLGALFVLNHRTPFALTAPPIRPIAEQAHREGALLDLDKHNWPWSLMLIPVAGIDLFELSNNSVWRTNFGFKDPGQSLPPWADIEQESPGVLTEWGWLQFGFEMYYALLNCGFQLSPTAGTASGVHPVPLGHSRVYVHTGVAFDLNAWLAGLKNGRSFVTTGPMLLATVRGEKSGARFRFSQATEVEWSADVYSPDPITRIELLVNGQVQRSWEPKGTRTEAGAWQWTGSGKLDIKETAWVVFRTWSDQPDGRKRFAHTGAWYFDVENQPIRPPRIQIEYLIDQMERSLESQRKVLSPEAIREFEEARDFYKRLRP